MTIRRALPAVKKQTTAAFLAALADGDVKTAQVSFSQSNFIRASHYSCTLNIVCFTFKFNIPSELNHWGLET